MNSKITQPRTALPAKPQVPAQSSAAFQKNQFASKPKPAPAVLLRPDPDPVITTIETLDPGKIDTGKKLTAKPLPPKPLPAPVELVRPNPDPAITTIEVVDVPKEKLDRAREEANADKTPEVEDASDADDLQLEKKPAPTELKPLPLESISFPTRPANPKPNERGTPKIPVAETPQQFVETQPIKKTVVKPGPIELKPLPLESVSFPTRPANPKPNERVITTTSITPAPTDQRPGGNPRNPTVDQSDEVPLPDDLPNVVDADAPIPQELIDNANSQTPLSAQSGVTGLPDPDKSGESILTRLTANGFEDGKGEPVKDLPNARVVSNAVSYQETPATWNKNDASDLLWTWGQFIDHDMVASKEGSTERFDIDVPKGDPRFDPKGDGDKRLVFTRNEGFIDQNGVRQQINEQTPEIDASMVYGATEELENSLREFSGGRMKLDENGNLLRREDGTLLAGDKRADEQPGLTAMHTLMVREHNRIADNIAKNNPQMDDQTIFLKAKRSVQAQVQAITYNEFLPVLLGDKAPKVTSPVVGERPKAEVSVEFAAAAYRIGHTLVNETIQVKKADGSYEQLTLGDVFMRPNLTNEIGIEGILAGQSEQRAQSADPSIVDSLRDNLFGPADQDSSIRLDLATLNIQRGRDVGLPSYNAMRESMGLARIESFNAPEFIDGYGAKLASVYDSVDDIDLWVGGLAEKPAGTSLLGETFTKIVSSQFQQLADADASFFTQIDDVQLKSFAETRTLSELIQDNTSGQIVMDDTAFIVGTPDIITYGETVYAPVEFSIEALIADLLAEIEYITQVLYETFDLNAYSSYYDELNYVYQGSFNFFDAERRGGPVSGFRANENGRMTRSLNMMNQMLVLQLAKLIAAKPEADAVRKRVGLGPNSRFALNSG